MKWSTEAKSTLGRGAVFRVMLPLRAAETFERHPGPRASVDLDRRKVLIVADLPFKALYLALWLPRATTALIVYDSGTGIAALPSTLFDAVIAARCLSDAGARQLCTTMRHALQPDHTLAYRLARVWHAGRRRL